MKPIPGFPGYLATEEGHIWSNHSNRLLSESPDSHGYMKVNLRRDSADFTRNVHRLVAEAFLGVPSEGFDRVDHKDCDRQNNCISNLHFISEQDNIAKDQAGRYQMRNPDGHVVTIYNMAEFCRDFDLSDGHMHDVLRFRRNSHKGWTRVK